MQRKYSICLNINKNYTSGHLNCKKNPYSKTTYNPKLKCSMGDLDLNTKRWCERVKHAGYDHQFIYECQWQEELLGSKEKRDHVSSVGMAGTITARSALYGGRTEAIAVHATGDETHPIKYIDVVSDFTHTPQK